MFIQLDIGIKISEKRLRKPKLMNSLFLEYLLEQSKRIDRQTRRCVAADTSKSNLNINRAMMTKQEHGLSRSKVPNNKIVEVIDLVSQSASKQHNNPYHYRTTAQNNKQSTNWLENFRKGSTNYITRPTLPKTIPNKIISSHNETLSKIQTRPPPPVYNLVEQQHLPLTPQNYVNHLRQQIAIRITARRQTAKQISQQHQQRPLKQNRLAMKGAKATKEAQLQNEQPTKSYERELFFERRVNTEPLDLGVMSLDEVVDQSYNNGIVGPEIYIEYVRNSNQKVLSQFIALFIQNKLESWNFQQHKITLAHHRRLSELLVRLQPSQYKICIPYALDADTRSFLINLYELFPLEYECLLKSLDNISGFTIQNTFRAETLGTPPPYISQTTQHQFDFTQNQQKKKFQQEINLRLRGHHQIEKYRQSLCKKLGKEEKTKNKKKTGKHKYNIDSSSSSSKQADGRRLRASDTYSCESVSQSSTISFSSRMRKRPCL